MVAINRLAEITMEIAGKNLKITNIKGPTGVRGRNSNNKLISEKLNWSPTAPLRAGLEKTYAWISSERKKLI
jgi:nucleoside-diphosphate-sugar epimerase